MIESSPKGYKNTGKRRNYSLRTISPFPRIVFKTLVLQTRKNQDVFGKGLSGQDTSWEKINYKDFSLHNSFRNCVVEG